METLWTMVTSVATNMVSLMGTVSTGLMSNEIFQIVVGVVLFGIAMGIVFALVKKLKRRGR